VKVEDRVDSDHFPVVLGIEEGEGREVEKGGEWGEKMKMDGRRKERV